jgi:hypothetical protein
MAKVTVTLDNLGEKMFEAAKTSLGQSYVSVKLYLTAESEKLAVTLRMIVEGIEKGEISRVESKILLNQQKVASGAVLTAVEGMSSVAVQTAINAALKVVKDLVNAKAGFPLL